MSHTAVLHERKAEKKRGTAAEPVRAAALRKPAGSPVNAFPVNAFPVNAFPVNAAPRPADPRVRLSRRILGRTARHLSDAAWHALQAANRLVPSGRFQPSWAPAPLLKSSERSRPPLGFPRKTDSLCPKCVLALRLWLGLDLGTTRT